MNLNNEKKPGLPARGRPKKKDNKGNHNIVYDANMIPHILPRKNMKTFTAEYKNRNLDGSMLLRMAVPMENKLLNIPISNLHAQKESVVGYKRCKMKYYNIEPNINEMNSTIPGESLKENKTYAYYNNLEPNMEENIQYACEVDNNCNWIHHEEDRVENELQEQWNNETNEYGTPTVNNIDINEQSNNNIIMEYFKFEDGDVNDDNNSSHANEQPNNGSGDSDLQKFRIEEASNEKNDYLKLDHTQNIKETFSINDKQYHEISSNVNQEKYKGIKSDDNNEKKIINPNFKNVVNEKSNTSDSMSINSVFENENKKKDDETKLKLANSIEIMHEIMNEKNILAGRIQLDFIKHTASKKKISDKGNKIFTRETGQLTSSNVILNKENSEGITIREKCNMKNYEKAIKIDKNEKYENEYSLKGNINENFCKKSSKTINFYENVDHLTLKTHNRNNQITEPIKSNDDVADSQIVNTNLNDINNPNKFQTISNNDKTCQEMIKDQQNILKNDENFENNDCNFDDYEMFMNNHRGNYQKDDDSQKETISLTNEKSFILEHKNNYQDIDGKNINEEECTAKNTCYLKDEHHFNSKNINYIYENKDNCQNHIKYNKQSLNIQEIDGKPEILNYLEQNKNYQRMNDLPIANNSIKDSKFYTENNDGYQNENNFQIENNYLTINNEEEQYYNSKNGTTKIVSDCINHDKYQQNGNYQNKYDYDFSDNYHAKNNCQIRNTKNIESNFHSNNPKNVINNSDKIDIHKRYNNEIGNNYQINTNNSMIEDNYFHNLNYSHKHSFQQEVKYNHVIQGNHIINNQSNTNNIITQPGYNNKKPFNHVNNDNKLGYNSLQCQNSNNEVHPHNNIQINNNDYYIHRSDTNEQRKKEQIFYKNKNIVNNNIKADHNNDKNRQLHRSDGRFIRKSHFNNNDGQLDQNVDNNFQVKFQGRNNAICQQSLNNFANQRQNHCIRENGQTYYADKNSENHDTNDPSNNGFYNYDTNNQNMVDHNQKNQTMHYNAFPHMKQALISRNIPRNSKNVENNNFHNQNMHLRNSSRINVVHNNKFEVNYNHQHMQAPVHNSNIVMHDQNKDYNLENDYNVAQYVDTTNFTCQSHNPKLCVGIDRKILNKSEKIFNYTVLPKLLHPGNLIDTLELRYEFIQTSGKFMEETHGLDFNNITVAQLKDIIKRFGLNHQGKKANLIEELEATRSLIVQKINWPVTKEFMEALFVGNIRRMISILQNSHFKEKGKEKDAKKHENILLGNNHHNLQNRQHMHLNKNKIEKLVPKGRYFKANNNHHDINVSNNNAFVVQKLIQSQKNQNLHNGQLNNKNNGFDTIIPMKHDPTINSPLNHAANNINTENNQLNLQSHQSEIIREYNQKLNFNPRYKTISTKESNLDPTNVNYHKNNNSISSRNFRAENNKKENGGRGRNIDDNRNKDNNQDMNFDDFYY